MPPFGFHKRQRSPSPASTPQGSSRKRIATTKNVKQTLFETVDAISADTRTLEDNKKFLDTLHNTASEDDSSLSEADSDEFEDVTGPNSTANAKNHTDDSEDEDEVPWEDAIAPETRSLLDASSSNPPAEIADVSITVNDNGAYIEPLVSAATVKKGPSKRERIIRVQTHLLHVQTLMWHNTVRNHWLNDKVVQHTLVESLPVGVKNEVERWKQAMGMLSQEQLDAKKRDAAATKRKDKKDPKATRKSKGRDWEYDAAHAEQGVVNMSGGDPLLRLLKVLAAFWRRRFTVTAPGLRKQGYKTLRRLRDEIKTWEKNPRDAQQCGERVEDLSAFRNLARTCEGSRDIGAQLFTALLRALGLETRLVANLQPAGFGWSKAEEAHEDKAKKIEAKNEIRSIPNHIESSTGKGKARSDESGASTSQDNKRKRKIPRGNADEPIDLDDSESPLSSAPSDVEAPDNFCYEDDNSSVVDITPAEPKKRRLHKFDRDLAFPVYWAEVCSPATHRYIPVDPMVLSTIASSDDLAQTFEPRGKRAEMAKQVICYTVAFSADGSAKDVTVRYLKKHQLPGKTKGFRMPIDRFPIYNHKGKVERYEEHDSFGSLMLMYQRPKNKRTAADELEDRTDLKPFKPSTGDKEVKKESLQWYKQSAEYVLEQHLRREEAIRPKTKPVKFFTTGKGDNTQTYAVFLRKDVLNCKTVESWHKEGRAIKVGEQPIKYVPMRAVTLIRKREIEDAQRETGEKLKQGLYSQEQTEWIIPPPIVDGVIPKNAFGNMDVYVPTMVPEGAVHLPLKGSAKICKKLNIDFAEACTGFEFGKQRAVPVITGVVVAKEHELLVRDAWTADRAEQRRKEDTKRTAVALKWWRKFVLGLRVVERMRTEYASQGPVGEEINPFVSRAQREGRYKPSSPDGDASDINYTGGGFLVGSQGDAIETLRNNELSTQSTAEHGGGEDEPGGFLKEDASPDQTNGSISPTSFQTARNGRKEPASTASDEMTSLTSISQDEHQRKQKVTSSQRPQASSDSGRFVSGQGDATSVSDRPEIECVPPKRWKNSSVKRPHSPSGVTSRTAAQRRGNTMSKTTPLKSQFFNTSDKSSKSDTSHREFNDDSDDDLYESEIEVTKPRRTTARTRGIV